MDDLILKEKEEYWDNEITLKDYISRLKKYNYIDCSGNWDYEFHYIVENLEKLDDLQQNYERIYTENCKLREQHNITDISLLDENYKLQQENEFLKLSNPEMNMGHFRIVKENKRKIDNLRKENERLKKLNENASKVCVAEHKYGVEKAEEARDYKSRCEKAITKLKNWRTLELDDLLKCIEDAENILQGSDKE